MGILCIGAGLGPVGTWAALFHVWNNCLTKASLFLTAGNLHRAAGARTVDEVSGMSRVTPYSAAIFIAGLFAVTALPPFGPFFSELSVLRAAFETSHGGTAAVFLGCLLFAFFGLTRLAFAIVDGRPRIASTAPGIRFAETSGLILPPLALLALSCWLGVSTPAILKEAWNGAVSQLLFVK